MQIFPVSQSSNTHQDSALRGRDAWAFNRMLSSSLEAVAAEITPLLDAVPDTANEQTQLLNDYTPELSPSEDLQMADTSNSEDLHVIDAPYADAAQSSQVSQSTLESTTVPLEEIRLTDAEVREVAQNLRDQGVDDATVRRVEELAGHPNGVSVQNIVEAVAGEKPAELTDGDLERIGALADKLDPSGALRESLLDDIKNGRVLRAWGQFTQAVAGQSGAVSIDAAEMASLAKGLRLNANDQAMLQKAFGGAQSLLLSSEDIQLLIAPAQKSMDALSASRQQMADQLHSALGTVVDTARARMEHEKKAHTHASKQVEQSQTLMRDTILDTFDVARPDADAANAADKPVNHADTADARGKQNANADVAPQPATENIAPKQAKADALESKIENLFAQKAADAKDAANAEDAALLNKQNDNKNQQDANQRQRGGMDDPWEALLNRLEARHNTNTQATPLIAQTMGNAADAAQQAQAARQTTRAADTALMSRVLSQVEEGVLTTLNNGTKQLTLQLTPDELGAMSLVLSTRNGEVSAVLKPENAETAALLTQQIEQLKTNLEMQGLKVDSVEVQTPGQDTASNWHGMDQHNAAQEHSARQQAMERARRLSLLHEADASTAIMTSATVSALRSSASSARYVSIVA